MSSVSIAQNDVNKENGLENIIENNIGKVPHERLILLGSRRDLDEGFDDYVKSLMLANEMDWDAFLGWILSERISGVVYENIREYEEVEDRVLKPLALLKCANTERNKCQQSEIMEIGKKFEESKINYSFLKGSILNFVLYKEGERISNDTDIMVSVHDLNEIDGILKSMGYIQGRIENGEIIPATKMEKLFARLNTYEIIPYVKKTGNVFLPIHEVDVNFKLSNEDNVENAIDLLEEKQLMPYGNGQIRTLSKNAFFIYLCIHLYREATMIYKIANGDDIVLYKYMDIHHFVAEYKEELDWDRILVIATKLERANDVYYTMYYTEVLYPNTFRQEIMDMFKGEDEEFLFQYKGRDNSCERYEWKTEFRDRCFNRHRSDAMLEQVFTENQRFNEIRKGLRN